jgi:hypothetical protein
VYQRIKKITSTVRRYPLPIPLLTRSRTTTWEYSREKPEHGLGMEPQVLLFYIRIHLQRQIHTFSTDRSMRWQLPSSPMYPYLRYGGPDPNFHSSGTLEGPRVPQFLQGPPATLGYVYQAQNSPVPGRFYVEGKHSDPEPPYDHAICGFEGKGPPSFQGIPQPHDAVPSESQTPFGHYQVLPALPQRHRVSDTWDHADPSLPPPVGMVGIHRMTPMPAESLPEGSDDVGTHHPNKRKRVAVPDRTGNEKKRKRIRRKKIRTLEKQERIPVSTSEVGAA